MYVQSLRKVGQGLLELLIGNEKVTDGLTDQYMKSNMSLSSSKGRHNNEMQAMVFNSSGVNVSKYIKLSTREMAWYNYLIPFYINICEKCKDDNFNFSFMFFFVQCQIYRKL